MARFRWITQCRALDVLEMSRTNAQFHRLFEEYGLGEHLDSEGGVGLTTPKLHTLLQRLLRRSPELRDTEGSLISDGLIREAASHLSNPPDPEELEWRPRRIQERPQETALRNSLAVDGWAVSDGCLIPVAPVELAPQRLRLKANLDGPCFADAKSRLDQLEAAIDGGNWESANSMARGFLAAVFVGICQTVEKGKEPREESDARKLLAEAGFFAPGRQAGKSPEAEFVWKMSAMMGTEGAHAGATTPDVATYRYALALLTADHFAERLATTVS